MLTRSFLSSTQKSLAKLAAAAVAALGLAPGMLKADENLFGYTYGAETLPAGRAELYTWQTVRVDKGRGDYLGWDQKFEVEYGITDRLQVSFYANTSFVDISNVPGFEDKDADFGFWSTQMALKYNILSPFKDPVGLAFYIEPGYIARDNRSGESEDAFELETMVILQKNFLDDTLIWSTNLFAEFEWADGEQGWGPTVFTGLAYRFAPNWFIGVEGHWDADFEGLQWDDAQHWDVFAGPVLHYGAEKWWATLSVQKNLASWPETPGHSRNLDDHEDIEFRLKLGWNF